MVKKRIFMYLIPAVVLLIIGFFFWWGWREERAVKKMVIETASMLNKSGGKLANAGVFKLSGVDNLFAQNVLVACVEPEFKRSFTRDELKKSILFIWGNSKKIDIQTDNIDVSVTDGHAVFSCDIQVDADFSAVKRIMQGVYIVRGSAEKTDDKWQISSLVIEPVVR